MYLGAFVVGVLDVSILKTAVGLFTVWFLFTLLRARRNHPRTAFPGLTDPRLRAPVVLILWGLAAFLVSEIGCAVEIYVIYHSTPALRFVHALSSAVGAALLAAGVLLAVDRLALHYLDESRPCLMVATCRGCPRRADGRCRFHTTYALGLVLLLLATVPVFLAPVHPLPADAADLALPLPELNAAFDRTVVPFLERSIPHWTPGSLCFTLPEAMTLAEFRYIPGAALVLGLVALAACFRRGADMVSFLCVAMAAGALSFSYLDAVLYNLLPHVYLASVGHEVGELMGLLLLWAFLHCACGQVSSSHHAAEASSGAEGTSPAEASASGCARSG